MVGVGASASADRIVARILCFVLVTITTEELFSLPVMVALADAARAVGMGKKARDNAIARNRFSVEIVSKGPFRSCRKTDLLRYLGYDPNAVATTGELTGASPSAAR